MNEDRQNQGFDLGQGLSQLWQYLNERKLELQQPNGRVLFGLPLAWAALIVIVALVTQLVVPLLIAVVVLLVLKFRFVLRRSPSQANGDSPPNHS